MGVEPFHENVGWDFEKNVWGVEDNQSGIGLFAGELQVLCKTESQGIGDVDSVRVSTDLPESNKLLSYLSKNATR